MTAITKLKRRLFSGFIILLLAAISIMILFSLLLQAQTVQARSSFSNPYHGNSISQREAVSSDNAVRSSTSNEPPVANDDAYAVDEDVLLSVVAPGVLDNDSDPNDDAITATLYTAPANGSVTLNGDGSFVYTPTTNFNGSDSFVYKIVDGPTVPVGYWSFNEGSGGSAADLSGYGHTATLVGDVSFTTTTPTTPTFPNAYSLDFDGSDDWVTMGSSSYINLGSFSQRTVMAWFRADDVGVNSRRQIIWEEGGGTNGLNIYLYDGAVYGGAWSSHSEWAGAWISSTDIISGQWHHATLVLDSASSTGPEPDGLYFYLDGQLVGVDEGAQLGNHFGGIGIGDMVFDTNFHDGWGPAGDGGFGFAGLIDEVQVYNDVLSAAQIQSLMSVNLPSLTDMATVNITVSAVNDPPSAAPDTFNTLDDQPLTAPAPGVLSNDTDIDGDVLSATLVSDVSSGTLDLALDGSFIYTPSVSGGVDSFTYAAGDGLLQSDPTTVTLRIVNAAPFGTCADFETGEMPDYFLVETTINGAGNGRVQVSADYPYSGNYALTLDTECDGYCSGSTTQAAVMVVDLAGATETELSFQVHEFTDENHEADGVFISDDNGVTWEQVVNLNNYPPYYTPVALDLDDAVAAAGMSFADNFLIKFQSEDDAFIDVDGYAFDNICVRAPQADINALPTSLSGAQYRDEVSTQTLQIDNSGSLSLTWNLTEAENDCAAPGDLAWLSVLTTTGVLSAAESSSTDVVFGDPGLASGDYSGLLCLNSNDPDTPTLPVTVTLEAWPYPGQLTADPTGLSVEVARGYTATLPLELTNVGEAAVSFTLVEVTDGALVAAPASMAPPAADPPAATTAVIPESEKPAALHEDRIGVSIAPSRTDANPAQTAAVPLAFSDPLFQIDLEPPTGQIYQMGLEYAQGSYWVTSDDTDANYLFELDEDGTVLHRWEQSSTSPWGWNDLAFDGIYLYGSDSNDVAQIDPETGQATGVTIPCPATTCRALAYDPATDHFWTANFSSDIWEFDRSGTIINQYTNNLQIFGAAWDVYSDGGPYLWVWSQDGTPQATATQIDPETGQATGVAFTGYDGGWESNYAGGADIVDNHPDYPGQLLFVGLHQSFPATLIGYDLGTFSEEVDWAAADPVTGTVPVPGPQTVNVTFDAAAPSVSQSGTYTASLWVVHDGDDNPLTIPLTMTVYEGLTLDVNMAGSGSGGVTVAPEQTVYRAGDVVTLTAVADTGSAFTGWSGDVTAVTDEITMTMAADTAVTATFDLLTYTLSLNTAGSGGGAITADPDKSVYQHGEVVTLTAAADPGSTFSGWSGDVSGADNPLTLTLTGDTAVTATFDLRTYTLSLDVAGAGGGVITADPDKSVYQHGDVVTLTAAANPGSTFSGWSGDVTGADNPLTLTLTADTAVTATFDAYLLYLPLILAGR